MHPETVIAILFFIFTGATIVSTVALFTRQSLLIAYIIVGIILGPCGLKLITDTTIISQASDIGIIFLLFLLGLNLHPQKLFHMLRKATLVAVISSLIFAIIGYGIGRFFGFTNNESIIIGIAMMFSSTIIGLKLLPTTILHHRHTGEVMISVLLLQDLIAIIAILFITAIGGRHLHLKDILLITFSLPTLLILGYFAERFVLIPLITRFDHVKEYIFLLSIGWCLGMAEIANLM